MANSERGLDFDWTKVDEKFRPLINAFCDAESVVDLDESELTQMQRNFVCTSNTYFIEDMLRELTAHPEEIETGGHPLFIRQEKDLRDKAISEGPDYVIKKIKTAGKWMEFWFSSNEKWDECCKQYILYGVIDKAGLDEHVLNNGFIGLIVTWPTGSDKPTIIRKTEDGNNV